MTDLSRMTGRDAFARETALRLKAGASLALFGPRGTNKTSFTVRPLHAEWLRGRSPFRLPSLAGRTRFYSTGAANVSSQRVTERLGLAFLGPSFVIS